MKFNTMNQSTIEMIALAVMGILFIIVSGFLLTQALAISASGGRNRLLIAGVIGTVIGGVFLYESVTR